MVEIFESSELLYNLGPFELRSFLQLLYQEFQLFQRV
jgi:hypothetical protein